MHQVGHYHISEFLSNIWKSRKTEILPKFSETEFKDSKSKVEESDWKGCQEKIKKLSEKFAESLSESSKLEDKQKSDAEISNRLEEMKKKISAVGKNFKF